MGEGKKGGLGPDNDVLTTCNVINSHPTLTVQQPAIFFGKMEARATPTANRSGFSVCKKVKKIFTSSQTCCCVILQSFNQ